MKIILNKTQSKILISGFFSFVKIGWESRRCCTLKRAQCWKKLEKITINWIIWVLGLGIVIPCLLSEKWQDKKNCSMFLLPRKFSRERLTIFRIYIWFWLFVFFVKFTEKSIGHQIWFTSLIVLFQSTDCRLHRAAMSDRKDGNGFAKSPWTKSLPLPTKRNEEKNVSIHYLYRSF